MDFMHSQQAVLSQEIMEFVRDEGSDFNLLILNDTDGCHLFQLGIFSRGEISSHIGTLKAWFQNSR